MIFDGDGAGDKGCLQYSKPGLKLEPIADLAACKAAVAAMGYTATLNSTLSGPEHPKGCIVRAWPTDNQFYFNTEEPKDKKRLGPHGEDCAEVCKVTSGHAPRRLVAGYDDVDIENDSNGHRETVGSDSEALPAPAPAPAGFVPSPSKLQPSHLIVSSSVQGFQLDGFMFTGNKLEDSCTVRVQADDIAMTAAAATSMDLWADWLFYSEAYNASACGVQLLGLGAKDVARFGYIDMSLDVVDSAESTVLVDFMTGGRLSVRGNAGKARSGFMGVKLFAGLGESLCLSVSVYL